MRSAAAAVCVLAAGLTGHAAAQEGSGMWGRLEAARGQTVSVESLPGTKTAGTLLQVDAESLTLRVSATEVRVDRDHVRRVTTERRDSVKNGFVTGAVVGAGLAAGSSCHVRDRRCGTGARVAFVALGAAIWGAIGGSIDSSISKRVTLYEAPQPAK
jgi:hypothetical protein